ncbi:hypothetical protein FGO68_gene4279 [Halteria grandinella]|uniref:Uncharacterized protein n=1 Tax=Halteria grandinella TaxID=5974 RepID=A0A8J8P2X5_HALGN|nr:hypothetical protein FGO68_gene4279 [Halteria grandinella]
MNNQLVGEEKDNKKVRVNEYLSSSDESNKDMHDNDEGSVQESLNTFVFDQSEDDDQTMADVEKIQHFRSQVGSAQKRQDQSRSCSRTPQKRNQSFKRKKDSSDQAPKDWSQPIRIITTPQMQGKFG